MNHVAVIGGGIIGASWAVVFARRGLEVTIVERDAACLAGLPARLAGMIERSASLLGAGEQPGDVAARIGATDALAAAVGRADYVQEAVSENLALKRTLFAELDALAPAHALLASSTSTYGASQFTEALAGRARCLVAHPMTPPHLSPVVEMAASAWTDPQALAGAEAFMRSLGQHPVRIRKEIPGFVLNRLQGALLMEMFRVIADDVISPADADALISQGLGLRWATLGPLEGVDLNAPGGIADYLQRYGHIFNDMAVGQGLPAPVDAELISALDGAMRAALPLERLEAKRGWRDRAIAGVRVALHDYTGEKP
ncbi:3-hydroxyacyl-CoA dehydrogenase [Bordetella bronchiseptica MBORD678]|uniref:3-hydroxyacyl-CoA dehydrogenase n=1 Tax=Bordetella bronchiseptica TaxID=518 RepID=UPI0004A1376A|nr:3-hydroxyacyl-CoA dehydrogenase [Bordetella bronchiseptica]KDC85096.1 3-hydroxyacyl-CoA dehydrogenase [Bordetella bronchiseptica MBORD668]KDC87373.1 3-hydroxyacyl-CoA dehydrogenase [Bordetella bronchiseptica MBORD665]KDD92115.1 3-hydroxyacyl-CoA dehydrogenase [Bordetella bronchiseptica MBORD678]